MTLCFIRLGHSMKTSSSSDNLLSFQVSSMLDFVRLQIHLHLHICPYVQMNSPALSGIIPKLIGEKLENSCLSNLKPSLFCAWCFFVFWISIYLLSFHHHSKSLQTSSPDFIILITGLFFRVQGFFLLSSTIFCQFDHILYFHNSH